jgi:hypothetical protein
LVTVVAGLPAVEMTSPVSAATCEVVSDPASIELTDGLGIEIILSEFPKR